MWSVRMRASRATKSGLSEHISGAETICPASGIARTVSAYADRALSHPRGVPDTIVITAENIPVPLLKISSLPLRTLRCATAASAKKQISALLAALGVRTAAVSRAFAIVGAGSTMRGAALVQASSGTRLEQDRRRGVRASRFGLATAAGRILGTKLIRIGLNTQTVAEALSLASKVASCDGVLAELCVSDDPDYTTGYLASRKYGYLRVPRIKAKGSRSGGRVIFLDRAADPVTVTSYLEQTPVMITRIAACSGETTLDEILGRRHQ